MVWNLKYIEKGDIPTRSYTAGLIIRRMMDVVNILCSMGQMLAPNAVFLQVNNVRQNAYELVVSFSDHGFLYTRYKSFH